MNQIHIVIFILEQWEVMRNQLSVMKKRRNFQILIDLTRIYIKCQTRHFGKRPQKDLAEYHS